MNAHSHALTPLPERDRGARVRGATKCGRGARARGATSAQLQRESARRSERAAAARERAAQRARGATSARRDERSARRDERAAVARERAAR